MPSLNLNLIVGRLLESHTVFVVHYRLNTAECYDPDQRAWSMLPDMNEKRSDASASNLNGRVENSSFMRFN